MRTELHLPYPPSLNQLFATSWTTKQRFRSKKYMQWTYAAGAALNIQKHSQHLGFVSVKIRLGKPDNRTRDLDNLGKAIMDLLVDHCVIKDDSYVSELHLLWDSEITGAFVTINDAMAMYPVGVSPAQQIKPTSRKGGYAI